MDRNSLALFLLLGPAWLGTAAAQPVPIGPEVRVDTLTAGDPFPRCPSLAVERKGTFEIAWDYGSHQPAAIYSRHFAANLQPTDASQVLLGSEGFWPELDSITRSGRGFDVLWHIHDDTGIQQPAFYRRHLNLRGVPDPGRPQRIARPLPYVWAGPGEGLIAGYYQAPIATFQLLKVAPNGRPTLVERRINTRRLTDPIPYVLPLSNGGFVGVLEGTTIPTDGSAPRRVLRARLFSPLFVPVGPDFDVNTIPSGPAGTAPFLGPDFKVAANPRGGFAVIWRLGDTIYARFFDAAGHAAAPEVPLVKKEGDLSPVAAAINGSGDLLLLWFQTFHDPLRTDLKIQLFDSHGAPLGLSAGLPTTASGPFQQPFCGDVAAVGKTWLVTWAAQEGDLEPSAVFVRRFAGD